MVVKKIFKIRWESGFLMAGSIPLCTNGSAGTLCSYVLKQSVQGTQNGIWILVGQEFF